MIDERDILERALRTFEPQPGLTDRVYRRRDRKRRHQRIAAGVVGIAVFVAAVSIVTTGVPFDRTETPVVPGGAGTGPAETGPTATPTVAPDAEWDGYSAGGALHGSIPPEGVALSSPAEVELIARHSEFRVGFVLVYADGRVVWYWWPDNGRVYEQRLTPEGVDLVRSGALEPSAFLGSASQAELPASIWADPEVRLYAPPRYAVCFSLSDGEHHQREVDPSQVVDLLPAPAQALLRGEGEPRSYEALGNPPTECLEVATDEARALQAILSDAGVEPDPYCPDVWCVRRDGGGRVGIDFLPLFPDRVWHALPG